MKKAFIFVLTVVLLLNSILIFGASAEVTPDENAAPGSEAYTAWLVQEGYVGISSWKESITVKDGSVKYYLTDDIILPEDNFWLDKGVYNIDGNGHTVYRVADSAINTLTGGSIKNITFSKFVSAEEEAKGDNGETVTTTFSVFGAWAKNATFENVVVDIQFGQTTAGYMGMFAREGVGPLTIKKCVNKSSAVGVLDDKGVNNQHGAVYGGFFGYADVGKSSPSEEKYLIFEDCVNYGDISGSHAGGFIGSIMDGGASDGCPEVITLTRCKNYGKITGIFDASGVGLAGGFIGGFGTWGRDRQVVRTNCSITFDQCENYGSVVRYSIEDQAAANNRSEVTAVGGLIGFAGISKYDYKNNTEYTGTLNILIKDCKVENLAVKGESPWEDGEEDYTQGYAAGLIGYVECNLEGDGISIQNTLVNNVAITAGDPASASLYINFKSDCGKTVEFKNTFAVNCTKFKQVAIGACTFTTLGSLSDKVTVDKAQAGDPADGKIALRFLGTVDSTNYIAVACLVEEKIGSEIKYYVLSEREVYETLNAKTRPLTKADFGNKPITALEIEGGVAADVTATYRVTPYALTYVEEGEGEILFGITKTVTLTNGVLS